MICYCCKKERKGRLKSSSADGNGEPRFICYFCYTFDYVKGGENG